MKKALFQHAAILTAATMLCLTFPLTAASEITPPTRLLTLASEDFSAYSSGDDIPNVGGGFGWDDNWSVVNNGMWTNGSGHNYAFTWWGSGTRTLAAPLKTDEAGVYYLTYTAFNQGGFQAGVALGNIYIGTFQNKENDVVTSIYSSVGPNNERPHLHTDNIIETGNVDYNYKAKLTFNGDCRADVNLKAYLASESEPDEWLFAEDINVDLGASPIESIMYYGYNGSASVFFTNIVLSKVMEENVQNLAVGDTLTSIAYEDWYDYSNGWTLKSHSINSGRGWDGVWSSYRDTANDADCYDAAVPPPYPADSPAVGEVGALGRCVSSNVYDYMEFGYANARLARRLGEPINLRVNSEIEIRADIAAQSPAYERIILGDTGLQFGFADQNPVNLIVISNGRDSIIGSGETVVTGNGGCTLVLNITLSSNGDAVIGLKAYETGYTDENHLFSSIENIPFHFSAPDISYIVLHNEAWAGFFGKIEIKKSSPAVMAKIGSGGAQTNVYLSFSQPIPASLVNETSITATAAPYSVAPLYANTTDGVKTASGAIVTLTYSGLVDKPAEINVNIPSAEVNIPILLPGLEPVSIGGVEVEPLGDDGLTISFDLKGFATDGGANALIIGAVYDPDGVLLGVGTYNKTAYSENGAAITVDKLDLDNFGYIKVFGWNSFATLSPACPQPAVWSSGQ
jgi:hypothetical protein